MNFDLQVLLDNRTELLTGILTTLELFAAVMVVCTPLSLIVALARVSSRRGLARSAAVYVNVIRAMPLLVVLFFTFYGLPAFGIFVPPFAAAFIGLALVTTAFLSEDMRAGLLAVPKGQFEAAAALGLSPARFVIRILVPQALPILCAPFFTRAIVTMKATSIASLVAVSDITAQSMAGITTTYRSTEFLAFAALAYIALNAVLALLQALVQRRVALK